MKGQDEMKNYEAYPNTKDALEAWNVCHDCGDDAPFAVWAEREYIEPRKMTLLEAAQKREREATCKESLRVGNAAAMREALEQISSMGEQIDYQLGSSEETVYAFRNERCLAHNISECARAALSAPPRNCDVGTAEEQASRFIALCDSLKCPSCPCRFGKTTDCALNWAQMPYEEVK